MIKEGDILDKKNITLGGRKFVVCLKVVKNGTIGGKGTLFICPKILAVKKGNSLVRDYPALHKKIQEKK